MKKIVDHIIEKGLREKKSFALFNAGVNLTHYSSSLQQENTIIDLIDYLYNQNEALKDQIVEVAKYSAVPIRIIPDGDKS